ncbi:MAG: DNA topoisomerase, partial [Chloroflexota bacterium]
FSDDYLPKKPRFFRAKARLAQEAHEAIRPTMVSRTPDSIKHALSSDQYKLYDLIWRRFVSSQMAAAVYSTQSIDISATAPGSSEKPYLFRATGSRLIFPGFLAVMRSGDKEEDKELPELVVKEILRLLQLFPEQHFTEPPPRFTEASLIKAMEEEGIGRPSTYASILSTIQQRGYVETKGRALKPTAIGIQVNDLLVEYFPDVFSLGFTQQMENNLDAVAVGDSPWVKTVREFYQPFAVKLEVAKREMPNVKAPDEPVGKICPECGEQLIYKWGRFGKFIACSNYPTCRHTEAVVSSTGVKCPQPDCDGDLVKRRTRKGRTFYGCSNYPKCDLSTWKRPLRHKCPSCGGLLVAQRKGIAKCVECKLEHDRSKLK